ncbi:MAG: hypothetical protein IKB96_09910, partial [Prevotella sp.]|nr:hypothetical protein [Prevotella sp.]
MQSHSIFNSVYGFDKEQIFYAKLDEERAERAYEIVQKLETISGVECVATSQSAIGTSDLYTEWGREDDEHKIT